MKRGLARRYRWGGLGVWTLLVGCATQGFDPGGDDAFGEGVEPGVEQGTAPNAGATGGAAGAEGDEVGDGVRGGSLYDDWAKALYMSAPTTVHPLQQLREPGRSGAADAADSWRCVSCHGWDYRGDAGVSRTGFVGVAGTALSEAEIVVLLRDADGHSYGDYLGDEDLWDLAAFVKLWGNEAMLTTDARGRFAGDLTAGEQVYRSSCAKCHGPDGLSTAVPGGGGMISHFPGAIANAAPEVFVHKLRFGQPGTAMPGLVQRDRPALQNLAAYVQSLPGQP